MKKRCNNASTESYNNYGGKGIGYSSCWESFEGFWKDMQEGYSENLTLERIDPKKDYSKENCTWIEKSLQAKNKSKYANNTTGLAGSSVLDYNGIPQLVVRISDNLSGKRLKKTYSLNKYSIEEALILAEGWRKDKMEELQYGEHHGD